MTSLADLLDLQDVDLQIDRLLHDRQSLPELDAFRTAHGDVQRLTAEQKSATETLRQTSLELDKRNGELEMGEAKLEAEQNRLYAGGLSARDAEYMRREVEMLKRKNETSEERILELMEQREGEERRVDELQRSLEAAQAEKTRLEALISAAWKDIDAQLARKEARKADIVPLIEEELLALYEELRPAKDGVAVGRLAEGVCGGCHLRLTPAEQLEAKRSSPPRCLHCRRILVP